MVLGEYIERFKKEHYKALILWFKWLECTKLKTMTVDVVFKIKYVFYSWTCTCTCVYTHTPIFILLLFPFFSLFMPSQHCFWLCVSFVDELKQSLYLKKKNKTKSKQQYRLKVGKQTFSNVSLNLSYFVNSYSSDAETSQCFAISFTHC